MALLRFGKEGCLRAWVLFALNIHGISNVFCAGLGGLDHMQWMQQWSSCSTHLDSSAASAMQPIPALLQQKPSHGGSLGPCAGAEHSYSFWEQDKWMYNRLYQQSRCFKLFFFWHSTITWVFAQPLAQLLKLGRRALWTSGKQWGRRRRYLLSRAIIYHFQTVRQDKE